MPRLIRHDALGPHRIEPQDKPVFICACGLSQSLPLCDGSHKSARQEPPDRLCVYDRARVRIIETREDLP